MFAYVQRTKMIMHKYNSIKIVLKTWNFTISGNSGLECQQQLGIPRPDHGLSQKRLDDRLPLFEDKRGD